MSFVYPSGTYIAIIGDIVDSKKLQDRNGVQVKLSNLLDTVNKHHEGHIVSNFMITIGDEFQGVLNCGHKVMDIITEIEANMYPTLIRFGIGIGTLHTKVNREVPLGADGPAYYNARKMIEELKKIEKMNKTFDSNIMIASEGEHSTRDMLLNSVLSLCYTIKSKWTKRQREVIISYLNNEENQHKTAKKLNIGQSSVNKAIVNSGFYSYKNGIDTTRIVLSEIIGKNHV